MHSLIKNSWLLWLLLLVNMGCQKKQEHTGESQKAHTGHAKEQSYTCPMHPQIMESKAGSCPICGMDLVAVSQTQSEAGIMLSSNQMQLANIKVEEVGYGNIGNNTLLTATTVADENLTAQISSRTSGRIEKLYVKQVGEQIKKGQPLYDLYSEVLLTLQQEYLLALAQQKALGDTEQNYSRILEAAKDKLLRYGMSESQINRVGNQGKANPSVTFFSKQAGLVEEIAVTEGQYIAEGGLMLSIVDLSNLWVEAQLYPLEASSVQIGAMVEVRMNGYANEPLKGKVIFLNPELQSNSKIILLRAQVDNPHLKFQPGMQASLTLTNPTSKVLTIPMDAVIRDGQGSYVWKQTAEGTFSPVMVKLGDENAFAAQVTSGLAAGDKIVISGAYLLHSEYILKKGGNPMTGHDHSQMSM